MTLREMQSRAWRHAEAKGFHGAIKDVDFGMRLALIHSEISEALEAYRDPEHAKYEVWYGKGGKPEGVAAELADAVIRIGDLCETLGIDLEFAVVEKMDYNDKRDFLHGGKRC